MGSRLYQFDPETEQFSRFAFESALTRPTPPKAIKGIYEDDEGALWLAVNHDGLYRLDAARENFQFYESPSPARAPDAPESGRPPPAIRPPINDLYGDSAGHIWTTTYNGYYRFDPRTETYEAFRAKSNPSGPDSYM
jgi:streptogramin lyase